MTPETIPDATGSTPVAWQDGQPFSPRYGDRYHTQSGARAQAEHVFLGGCGLPDAWSGSPPETVGNDQDRYTSGSIPGLDNGRNSDTAVAPSGPDRWTILETGFGLGLNFLSAWACWQASPARPATLRFVSTEAHPVSAHDIHRASADDPQLQPLAERLADAWPDTTTLAAWYSGNATGAPPCHTDTESETSTGGSVAPGRTSRLQTSGFPDPAVPQPSNEPPCLTLRFSDLPGTVELQLLLGDAATRLKDWHAQHGSISADSVFLDGFDPKKNPAMWDGRTMQAVARHCHPGTRIATWCVARSVRDALTQAGFRLQKRPGLPPKRHCLAGEWPGTP